MSGVGGNPESRGWLRRLAAYQTPIRTLLFFVATPVATLVGFALLIDARYAKAPEIAFVEERHLVAVSEDIGKVSAKNVDRITEIEERLARLETTVAALPIAVEEYTTCIIDGTRRAALENARVEAREIGLDSAERRRLHFVELCDPAKVSDCDSASLATLERKNAETHLRKIHEAQEMIARVEQQIAKCRRFLRPDEITKSAED